MKILKLGITVFLMANALPVLAQGSPFSSTIERVGCHSVTPICFVYLTDPYPNEAGCDTANSLRWNAEGIDNADTIYSTLLAAQASRKPVTFGFRNACVGAFPTFSWVSIDNP